MRKRKLITLETGLNEIDISYKDLGTSSVKLPIAILPAGAEIHNIVFDTFEKYKSSNVSNQINPDSCIKAAMMIGNEEDNQSFLTYTKEVANYFGHGSANTGDYFSNPNPADSDTKVVLENWIAPRVWTMGGSLSTPRYYLGGCGTLSAGLNFGGYTTTYVATTEEYNGSSWSAGGALNTARIGVVGAGSQTAGFAFGGYTPTYLTSTEEYNGSAWTGGGNLNTGLYSPASAGTQTAALRVGGWTGSPLSSTEEYNGASWTLTNDCNIEKHSPGGAGTQSNALCWGGSDGTYTTTPAWTLSEEYNGATWALTNSLNIEVYAMGFCGSQSSALSTGGWVNNTVSFDTTEEFDGISWRLSNSMNYTRRFPASFGSQSSGVTSGGFTGSEYPEQCEEYNQTDLSTIAMTGKLRLSITVV